MLTLTEKQKVTDSRQPNEGRALKASTYFQQSLQPRTSLYVRIWMGCFRLSQ